MLVEAGLLGEEQLAQALANHKKENMKLGQFLVRKGTVPESQIVDMLSRQMGLKKYRPDLYPIDMSLASVIPVDVVQKHQTIPLKKSGAVLTVAMVDPTDIYALDAIEVLTNTETETVICTEQEFNHLVGGLYGTYSRMGDVLGDMEDMQYDPEGDESEGTQDIEVSSLHDMAEEAPVVRMVNSILSQAVREAASDLHITPERDYVQLRFRVDGKLHEVPAPSKSMFLPIVSRLKILANLDIAVSRTPQDGRFTIKLNNREINIRASTLPTIYGESIVLRLLDTSSEVYSLEHLGMSESDRQKTESMIVKPYGMILSVGPTGSGKTTTLYSILKRINRPDINITTLEDPVECRLEKIRQVQLNQKAGMTFASGLRSLLRQDPDVIMVGEIRDKETANIAVQAALTGHRVLSTVHTNDAAGAISRLMDMGIEPFLVSSVMLMSIAQRLIRKVCPYCKTPYSPPNEALRAWGLEAGEESHFVYGTGCFNCMDTGYKGRTGIYEILLVDDVVRDMILQKKPNQEIIHAAQERGIFRSLKEDAAKKVLEGITTLEEAASAVAV
jgi:type IV pilus assembly protein PilB